MLPRIGGDLVVSEVQQVLSIMIMILHAKFYSVLIDCQ